MSERKTIVHKTIMIAALAFSVAALPFSIKACHAAIIIFLASWLFEGGWRCKLQTIRQSILLQAIIALFLFQVAGLAFSDDVHSAWFSIEKKIFFLLLPVAMATTAIRLSTKEVKGIVIVFVLACLAGTLLCISQAWDQTRMYLAGQGHINPYLASSSYFDLNPTRSETWLFFSYVSLAEGIGIHPAYLSLFLAFSILFLFYQLPLLKRGFARGALWALILYFSIFIVFLSSRIILLGLSVIFVALLARSIRTNQRSTALVVALVSLVFGFLIFLNPVSRYRSLQEINSSTFEISPSHQYTTAAQIRASLWWLAVKSVTTTNAFFGTGTGDVEKAMAEQGKHYAISNTIHSFDPHNQFLYTLLANGYPGVFLLLLCLGLPAFFGWIKRDYLLLGFLFLFCSLCLTESALELQKGIVFYSLFSALFFFHLNSFQTVNLDLRSLLHGGN